MKQFITLLILLISLSTYAQDVAVLKYNGGGDWYANPTAIPNLVEFTNKTIKTTISKNPQSVTIGSEDLYNFPLIFILYSWRTPFLKGSSNQLSFHFFSDAAGFILPVTGSFISFIICHWIINNIINY